MCKFFFDFFACTCAVSDGMLIFVVVMSNDATMESFVDVYGYEPDSLLTSANEVERRLWSMLSDRLLRFNPYSVDDETLLACAERGRWLPYPALTQMVVFHFHDIRRVGGQYPYDAMFFNVGDDPCETHVSVSALIGNYTYIATLRQVRSTVDGRRLTNMKMAERLQGKACFVSHALPTRKPGGRGQAYRMFTLKGDSGACAAMIRSRMIEAKIIMLGEVLAYPYCKQYLQCSRGFIDYSTPINSAINTIRHFPEVAGQTKINSML